MKEGRMLVRVGGSWEVDVLARSPHAGWEAEEICMSPICKIPYVIERLKNKGENAKGTQSYVSQKKARLKLVETGAFCAV